MKLITTFLFSLLAIVLFNYTLAQIPPFEWAGSSGGTQTDNIHGMNIDYQGNVINVGRFRGIADYDPGTGSNSIQANGSSFNTYIQKVNPDGTLAWVKSLLGASNSNYANSASSDSQGNIYITGMFSGTVDFNPNVGINNLTSTQISDAYILKLNALGDLIWIKTIDMNTGLSEGISIVVDYNDDLIVAGNYQGTADFDPGPAIVNETSFGSDDVFILKLNNNGNYMWHKVVGGVNVDQVSSVDVNNVNDVFIAGTFSSTADLEAGVGTTNITALGVSDIFIEKLDETGDFQWVKTFGGTGDDYVSSIKIDINGNIINTGRFAGSMDIDPGTFTTTLSAIGTSDIYVQKLDYNANFLWGFSQGSTGSHIGNDVHTDILGDVYLTGSFRNTVDFNPGSGVFNMTSTGGSDNPFIQKISASGSFEWAFSFSSVGEGKAIRIDNNKNIYIAGDYSASADFNPGAGTSPLTSNGLKDSYLVKLSQCTSIASSIIETACKSYTAPDLQVYTTSGIKTATIQNAAGCDSIITIDLTINTVNTAVTQTNDITIQATVTGAQYQWVDCNNNYSFENGATSRDFVATVNGSYAVIVTENGCSDTSSCTTINKVGLDDLDLSVLKAYPNPTSNIISIETSILGLDYVLTDQLGRVISKGKFDKEINELDIKSLEVGTYFIKTEGVYSPLKIIKH